MPTIQRIVKSSSTSPTDFTLHDEEHAFRVAEWMYKIIPSMTWQADVDFTLMRVARNPQGSTPSFGRAPVVRLETCAHGARIWQPKNLTCRLHIPTLTGNNCSESPLAALSKLFRTRVDSRPGAAGSSRRLRSDSGRSGRDGRADHSTAPSLSSQTVTRRPSRQGARTGGLLYSR